MVKTSSKKSSPKPFSEKQWASALKRSQCPYGCVLKTAMCSHLDNYISSSNRRSISATPVANIEDFDIGNNYGSDVSDSDRIRFVDSISKFDLTGDQINVLVGRYIWDYPYATIAKEYGISSPAQAYKLFKAAIKTLKRGGYKIEN